MTALDVVWVAFGTALVLAVLVDVFLTLLHPDLEGPIAKGLQRTVWRVAVRLGRRWSGHRRGLWALAGPLMIALTFATWILLLILGYALACWPFLDSYRLEPALGRVTFADALYYAGSTVTVLGYGDVTPVHDVLEVSAFLAAGVGFAMFTGIVTYVIELVSSIDERNRFALRIHDETGGSLRGSDLAVRCLCREQVSDLRDRYDHWSSIARTAQDKLHRYAVASLFYRSKDAVFDPEPAVRAAAEAVMAGYLLVADPRWVGLGPAVEHLDLAVTRLFGTLADQYLDEETRRALESPSPTDEDHAYLRVVDQDLRSGLGDAYRPPGPVDRAVEIAFRCRTTMGRLDDLTDWSREGSAEVPWAPAR